MTAKAESKAGTKTKTEATTKNTKSKSQSKPKTKAKAKFRRKCQLCGKFITDEKDAVDYKGSYVHANCLSASLSAVQTQRAEKEEERENKRKAVQAKEPTFKIPKKGLTEEEYAERIDFFDTVKSLLKLQRVPAKVYAMADRLTERYKNFTYPGMKETLLYYVRTQGKALTDDCMGIIPYYYDEAMAEAKRVEEAQHNAEATLNQIVTETEIVTIPPPSARPNNKIINIEEIG